MKPVLALLILAGCESQQPRCLEHCYWQGGGFEGFLGDSDDGNADIRVVVEDD